MTADESDGARAVLERQADYDRRYALAKAEEMDRRLAVLRGRKFQIAGQIATLLSFVVGAIGLATIFLAIEALEEQQYMMAIDIVSSRVGSVESKIRAIETIQKRDYAINAVEFSCPGVRCLTKTDEGIFIGSDDQDVIFWGCRIERYLIRNLVLHNGQMRSCEIIDSDLDLIGNGTVQESKFVNSAVGILSEGIRVFGARFIDSFVVLNDAQTKFSGTEVTGTIFCQATYLQIGWRDFDGTFCEQFDGDLLRHSYFEEGNPPRDAATMMPILTGYSCSPAVTFNRGGDPLDINCRLAAEVTDRVTGKPLQRLPPPPNRSDI